jgi:hypothetical protein
MHKPATVNISVWALREMTPAQHEALATEVLADGRWDAHDEVRIRWDGFPGDETGTILCQMMSKGNTTIQLGIEPDGYVHS